MGRKSLNRKLNIWMNGELTGNWNITSTGMHEFCYDDSWFNSASTRPISLSMPLQKSFVYRGNSVEAFFDNLLPDSLEIRKKVQSRFGTATTHSFDLLEEIGKDCVGAIQLLPQGMIPEDIKRINCRPVSEKEIEGHLISTVQPSKFNQDLDGFRISVAGAQEKTAFFRNDGWNIPLGSTPSTHIFKLPMGKIGNGFIDFSTSIENEWFCSQILRLYGMSVAETEMAEFGSQKVLIVKRFDRKPASDGKWWVRLPQEDMCQATGTHSGHKYESDGGPGIVQIMNLLLGSRKSADDRIIFFKAQILFWMLGAIDGHAKNFSIFLEPGGRFRLTPLYDVMSAYPVLGKGHNQIPVQKIKMAMAVSGQNRHYKWKDITYDHWVSTAKTCGLDSAAVENLISELTGKTASVLESLSAMIPSGFPSSVSDKIVSGLEKASDQLK